MIQLKITHIIICLTMVIYSCNESKDVKILPIEKVELLSNSNLQDTIHQPKRIPKDEGLREIQQIVTKNVKICTPCSDEFDITNMKGLLKMFNRDLKTQDFSLLNVSDYIVLPFCEDGDASGYYYCSYVFVLEANTLKELNTSFNAFQKIPNNTIFYKPPKNWSWHKKEDKIYFLYANISPEVKHTGVEKIRNLLNQYTKQ